MSLVSFHRSTLDLLRLEDRCTPATITVINTQWNAAVIGSLPWAVAQANSPASPGQDDIVFDYTALGKNTPVFVPLSTLVVTEGVKIHAGVSGQYAKFQNGVRPFEFNHFLAPPGLKESELRGGMFVNCNAGVGDGGAVKVTNGQVTVASSRFDQNQAQRGAAIFVAAEGTLIVTDNLGNSPADPATYPPELPPRAITLFHKNEAVVGGGAISTEGETQLRRAWFVENKTAGNGGGVQVPSQGKANAVAFQQGGVTFDPDVQFRRNEAKVRGGGVYYGSTAASQFEDVIFVGNKATGIPPAGGLPAVPGEGGAVCVMSGQFDLFDGAITSNVATNGGGVYVGGGTLECHFVTFQGNIAVLGPAFREVAPGTFIDDNCIFN